MDFAADSTASLIEKIFIELGDFARRASEDRQAIRDDLEPWASLPHPSGMGSMLTSKQASAMVDELTTRALVKKNLKTRVCYGDIRKEIGEGLVARFISEKRPIDQRQADRLLSWAAKRAEGRCGEFTFFYPVRFTPTKEPGEIDLGPVKLKWLRKFDPELFALAKGYMRTEEGDEPKKWTRTQVRRALEYYKSYKWFAEVKVRGCDEKRGEEVSLDVATASLDCLHFLIGRRATYRAEIGRFKVANDDRALAWIRPDKSLIVQTSYGSLDAMGFADGWSNDLERSDVQESLSLIRTVLEAKSDLRLERPLANRFLDAARWFGEGVRDAQSFSKIVKFITAIERLVVAGASNEIAETVSTRVADLTIASDNRADWEAKKSRVKRAYAARSELVHGSVSPFSESILKSVSECGDLAEETLYTMLHRLREDELVASDVSENQYANWFEGIRSWVERIHIRHSEESLIDGAGSPNAG